MSEVLSDEVFMLHHEAEDLMGNAWFLQIKLEFEGGGLLQL